MVQRVVYNACFGGFGFHEDAVQWVRENKEQLLEEYSAQDVTEISDCTISGELYSDGSGPKAEYTDHVHGTDISRDNELLADIVTYETEYTGQYNGRAAKLKVAEVPDGVDWTLDRYDGQETVKEKTRSFR